MNQSASPIYEDEQEWNNIAQHAGVGQLQWKLYGLQHVYALQGISKKYSGQRLKMYVEFEVDKHKLADQYNANVQEYETFIALSKKFST